MHAVLNHRDSLNRLLTLACAAACAVMVACGGTAAPPASTQTAPATPVATAQPTKVNIDEIFPAGRGRDLLLDNCTSCHTFVPIVILQMDKDAWFRNSRIHRSRVPGLSDADFEILYGYLVANFNPNRPIPKLPKELLDTWTTY